MRRLLRSLRGRPLVAIAAGLALVAGRAAAVEVGWTFTNASLTPKFNDHTTSMTFVGGAATSGVVTFDTVSNFGLPAMAAGDPTVMKFPAFSDSQGLALYNLGPANGGGAYINEYTMAWDILIPNVSANWFAFYNTNASNTNDADFYVLPQPADPTYPAEGTYGPDDFGIGTYGQFHGHINSNTWYRIVAVHDGATAKISKYINGTFVGVSNVNGIDGNHTLYTDSDDNPPPTADLFLLTDGDVTIDTNAGYISAYYYTDRKVDATTIAAWGAPKAYGLPGPGDVNFDGTVNIFDVNLVSSNWSTAGPTGDANHDGTVDIFDINLISSNWSPPGGGVAAVPEPAAWLLSAAGLTCLALGRRAAKR